MGIKTEWEPVDPLGEALHSLRMSGAFYCRSEFTAPWGLFLPAIDDSVMFHIVTSGGGWLEVDGEAPHKLERGDLVLVSQGLGHRLLSAPDSKAPNLFDLEREQLSERYEILRHGGDGPATRIICGAVRFDHPAARRLVSLLPAVIRVEASRSPLGTWLESTVGLLDAEARSLRPGGATVITRLADLLVIQAIRSWIAESPSAQQGWLGALQDEQIGRSLALIHREPSRAWTVESLAKAVGMSRSGLAARFTSLVGEPAMRYLARWRMNLALVQLQEEQLGLAELSSRLGYQSEAAFGRAFKRFIGRAPGEVRRRKPGSPQRASEAGGSTSGSVAGARRTTSPASS